MKEALQALMTEMKYVLCCINLDKMPFDGDDFHEALRLGEAALAQDEASDSSLSRQAKRSSRGEQEPISFGIRGGMAHDIGIKND